MRAQPYPSDGDIDSCVYETPSGTLSIIATMIKNSNGGHRNTEI